VKPADQTGRTTEGAESYRRVVAQLAQMPDVIGQLLQDHEADSTGRCRACTKSGTGYRVTAYPCPLARLARAALEIRQGGTR
jgi:hypothetical protein